MFSATNITWIKTNYIRTYKAHDKHKDSDGCLCIAILKAWILLLAGHGLGVEGNQQTRDHSGHTPSKDQLQLKHKKLANLYTLRGSPTLTI